MNMSPDPRGSAVAARLTPAGLALQRLRRGGGLRRFGVRAKGPRIEFRGPFFTVPPSTPPLIEAVEATQHQANRNRNCRQGLDGYCLRKIVRCLGSRDRSVFVPYGNLHFLQIYHL
jgi:hypothetical protein